MSVEQNCRNEEKFVNHILIFSELLMILGLMVSTLSVLRLLKIAYNVQVQTTARRLGGLAILHFVV